MFTVMCFSQTFFNKCRWQWGVPHKLIDPIAQRLPFQKYLASLFIIILATMLLMFSLPVEANMIGVNGSRAGSDQNWGVVGDYERAGDIVDFEVEGQLQSGDVYRGNLDLSFQFDTPIPIDIAFHSNNTLKGYTLSGIGRKNDIGVTGVVPVKGVDVHVGVFGANGNPFAPATALGTLTDAGFTEATFDGLGLADIELAEGLSIKDGSSLNGSVAAEFDVKRFELGIQALLELAGTNERVHQLLVDIATGGILFGKTSWRVSAEIGVQAFGDTVQHESAWIATVGYSW